MEIADIIRALHDLAGSDSVASAARALSLDLSQASTTRADRPASADLPQARGS